MTNHELAVVIPNCNGAQLLGACLTALAASNGPRPKLIVVDNGSTDDSIAVVGSLWPDAVVVANDHNTGFVTACNQGAAAADAPLILFLNNDAIVEPGTLADLVGAATRPAMSRAAVWQPPVLSADGTTWDSAGSMFTRLGFLTHQPGGLTVRDHPVPDRPIFAAKGAAMLVRSDVLRSLGGFQEGFFAYFEETDLCWRAKLRGWEVWYVDGAPVRHVGGVTAKRILSNEEVDFLFFRNRLHSLLTALGSRRLVTVVPLHILGALSLAVVALVTGRRERARGIVRALAWSATNMGAIKNRRQSLQSSRIADDDAVFLDVESDVQLRSMVVDGLGYLQNRPREFQADGLILRRRSDTSR